MERENINNSIRRLAGHLRQKTDASYSHCLAEQLALRNTSATTASLNHMIFTAVKLLSSKLMSSVHVLPPALCPNTKHTKAEEEKYTGQQNKPHPQIFFNKSYAVFFCC